LSCTPKRVGSNGHEFFPLSLKVLVLAFVIAALAGGAVAMTRPKPIDSAVLGSEWQCHEIAFVITTCALGTQRQAVPALETARADRYIFAPIR
jgi:hypothetical protein